MRFLSVYALLFATSFSSFAGIEHAPPSFSHQDGKAVYIDILTANYKITYDVANSKTTVQSELVFNAPEKGFPIFDLVVEPKNQMIDGVATTSKQISDPDKVSKFRALDTSVSAGKHTLTLTHEIARGLSFRSNTVSSAFWMSDLSDRQYLEQFLPTNFEYDQIAMTMRVEVIGAAGKPHVLRTNGAVTTISENEFEVVYPKLYTTSSIFYHLYPVGTFPTELFNFTSVDGRSIPVEIYTSGNLNSFVTETKKILNELEKDYGPFPHNKVVIYGAGSGGMEYSGATQTSLSALGHELFHSYNARGVMPAQGNAGWIDEAMSSWRDANYTTRSAAGSRTKMAGKSVYTRMTDSAAYSSGRDFLAWIAGRMEARNQNFKTYLRDYFTKNVFTTITTEIFRADLEKYSGLDLNADFQKYIYGAGRFTDELRANRVEAENPFHPRLTQAQRDALLWP